jgi:hypothetical protein
MSLVRWAKKEIDRNRRSRKAISTIMANLTMLIIVVSLASLLFVWAISSFGAYQGGAGYWFSSRSIANQERVSVEEVFFTGASHNIAYVYVRNVGQIPFTIASVYFNSTQYTQSQIVNVTQSVMLQTPTGIVFNSGITWTSGDTQTVTVATLRGTVVTTTWVS